MRDPKRIKKILSRIEKIWEKYPNLRLGQLIINSIPEGLLYYEEDEKVIEEIEKTYKQVEGKNG